MENTKKITAREMRFIVKSAIDKTMTDLLDTYGADVFNTKTVQHIIETEAAAAITELLELGEIQSLRARENWGKA